jgi:hypothetical protein
VPDYPEILAEIDALNARESQLSKQLDDLRNSPNLPIELREDGDRRLNDDILETRDFKARALHRLVKFPPHMSGHFAKLEEFFEDGAFEESVFIMTKFPNPDDEAFEPLDRVIRAVKSSIAECGYRPRIAMGPGSIYDQQLWANVVIHMLGCARGVAIYENRYRTALNPNVAMEWGWMLAADRDVLFLVDDSIVDIPADVGGYVRHPFSWNAPEDDVREHVRSWLNEPPGN